MIYLLSKYRSSVTAAPSLHGVDHYLMKSEAAPTLVLVVTMNFFEVMQNLIRVRVGHLFLRLFLISRFS